MSDYEMHQGKIKKVETELSSEDFAKQEFIKITDKDTLKMYQLLINTNNYIPDIDNIAISELKSIKM